MTRGIAYSGAAPNIPKSATDPPSTRRGAGDGKQLVLPGCVAQELINPDVNERDKLLLKDGKTSHDIPAPSSYSEQPERIQLSGQVGQYSFSRSLHLFWMIRKCLPVFLRRGALPGTAQDLKDTSLQY